MGQLSNTQYGFALACSIFSCTCSIIGSSALIFLISRNLQKVHNRTLMLLSVGDIVVSSMIILQPFLLRQDQSETPWAIGNGASCTTVGFLFITCIGITGFCSSFISVHFLLQIRYNWSDEAIASAEKVAYISAFVIPLLVSIPPIATDSYNVSYVNNVCAITEYPVHCQENDEVECIRGDNPFTLTVSKVGGFMIIIVALLGFFCTGLLYATVRDTIMATARNTFDNILDPLQKERMQQVSRQCIMYAIAYFNTFIWQIIYRFVGSTIDLHDQANEPGPYALLVITYIFFPLQGAFNFMIFAYPRFQAWRRALPDEGFWYLLRRTLSHAKIPTSKSSIGSDQAKNDTSDSSTDIRQ